MTLTELRQMLLISTILNYGLITIWFLAFVYAHDTLYRLHTRCTTFLRRPSTRYITWASPYTRSACFS